MVELTHGERIVLLREVALGRKKRFTKRVEDVWSLSVVPGDKTKQQIVG